MDKLIVTIIGIGLAAIVSISGADYIYSAYSRASARATASQWIAEATQIEAAARRAGGLAKSGDNWTTGTAQYLVTTYLDSLPKHDNAYVFLPCILSSGNTSCPTYVTDTGHTTDATILKANVDNAAVCEEINRRANRDTTTLTKYTAAFASSGYTIAKNANVQFSCAWFDLNGNNSYDNNSTDNYIFLYRVFMDR